MFNPDCRYMCEMEMFTRKNSPLVEELAEIKAKKEALEKKEKAIKNTLLFEMQRHHIKSFETETARVNAVDDCNVEKVNSKKLKAMYPSAYYQCCESGYRDGYLIVRMK